MTEDPSSEIASSFGSSKVMTDYKETYPDSFDFDDQNRPDPPDAESLGDSNGREKRPQMKRPEKEKENIYSLNEADLISSPPDNIFEAMALKGDYDVTLYKRKNFDDVLNEYCISNDPWRSAFDNNKGADYTDEIKTANEPFREDLSMPATGSWSDRVERKQDQAGAEYLATKTNINTDYIAESNDVIEVITFEKDVDDSVKDRRNSFMRGLQQTGEGDPQEQRFDGESKEEGKDSLRNDKKMEEDLKVPRLEPSPGKVKTPSDTSPARANSRQGDELLRDESPGVESDCTASGSELDDDDVVKTSVNEKCQDVDDVIITSVQPPHKRHKKGNNQNKESGQSVTRLPLMGQSVPVYPVGGGVRSIGPGQNVIRVMPSNMTIDSRNFQLPHLFPTRVSYPPAEGLHAGMIRRRMPFPAPKRPRIPAYKFINDGSDRYDDAGYHSGATSFTRPWRPLPPKSVQRRGRGRPRLVSRLNNQASTTTTSPSTRMPFVVLPPPPGLHNNHGSSAREATFIPNYSKRSAMCHNTTSSTSLSRMQFSGSLPDPSISSVRENQPNWMSALTYTQRLRTKNALKAPNKSKRPDDWFVFGRDAPKKTPKKREQLASSSPETWIDNSQIQTYNHEPVAESNDNEKTTVAMRTLLPPDQPVLRRSDHRKKCSYSSRDHDDEVGEPGQSKRSRKMLDVNETTDTNFTFRHFLNASKNPRFQANLMKNFQVPCPTERILDKSNPHCYKSVSIPCVRHDDSAVCTCMVCVGELCRDSHDLVQDVTVY